MNSFRTHYYAQAEATRLLADNTAQVSITEAGLLVVFQSANLRHEEIQGKADALRATFPALQVVNKRRRNRGVWPQIVLPLYACTNQHGHPAFTGAPFPASIPSPLSDGEATLESRLEKVALSAGIYHYIRLYYLCQQTGERFTTPEMENHNTHQVYQQYAL